MNRGNGMTYCNNNPINWIDPFGLDGFWGKLYDAGKSLANGDTDGALEKLGEILPNPGPSPETIERVEELIKDGSKTMFGTNKEKAEVSEKLTSAAKKYWGSYSLFDQYVQPHCDSFEQATDPDDEDYTVRIIKRNLNLIELQIEIYLILNGMKGGKRRAQRKRLRTRARAKKLTEWSSEQKPKSKKSKTNTAGCEVEQPGHYSRPGTDHFERSKKHDFEKGRRKGGHSLYEKKVNKANKAAERQRKKDERKKRKAEKKANKKNK